MPAAHVLHNCGFHDRIPTYRYEHDTFVPVNKNASELVALIDERLPDRPVLLICHSRGGLVGRRVAATLLRRKRAPMISVVTLGTPHLGTEAANAWWLGSGLYVIGNLYYYEAEAAGHDPDPGSVARGYLPSLYPPAGIEALRPGSEFLLGLKELEANTGHVVAYGGEFDPTSSGGIASIGAVFVAAFGSGLVGEPNDIVVPTASATATANGQVLQDSCSHFVYFANQEVLQALDGAASKLRPTPHPGVEVRKKQAMLKKRARKMPPLKP
jgi:pimeloyl-ACP methyl ester carboxylesterase